MLSFDAILVIECDGPSCLRAFCRRTHTNTHTQGLSPKASDQPSVRAHCRLSFFSPRFIIHFSVWKVIKIFSEWAPHSFCLLCRFLLYYFTHRGNYRNVAVKGIDSRICLKIMDFLWKQVIFRWFFFFSLKRKDNDNKTHWYQVYWFISIFRVMCFSRWIY